MSIDCTRPPLEYASEHERNFGGGLDEPHAKEQREPMPRTTGGRTTNGGTEPTGTVPVKSKGVGSLPP